MGGGAKLKILKVKTFYIENNAISLYDKGY